MKLSFFVANRLNFKADQCVDITVQAKSLYFETDGWKTRSDKATVFISDSFSKQIHCVDEFNVVCVQLFLLKLHGIYKL